MIKFVYKRDLPKSNKKISIRLTDCQNKIEVVGLIGSKLKAKDSPLICGKSLDALHDVISDYFIENWLKWHDVYIYGWGQFSINNPIFSQKVLTIIMLAYQTSLFAAAQSVHWEESSFHDSGILASLLDKRPCCFLILD